MSICDCLQKHRTLLILEIRPHGGITYLLGSCELARGRRAAAGEAWARVVPGSQFSERAIRGRMRLLNESGEFAAAERLIKDAAKDPRHDRTALLVLLVPMYSQLGRIDEAERLIEDRWEHLNARGEGALEPAIKLLRQHIDPSWKTIPIENLRALLDQAARLAPQDDRLWLGRANLAILTGDYDEAGRWLDQCKRSRPDDVPTWRARLSWGLATDRLDVVQESATHLPLEEMTPPQLHRLRVWIASKRGELETERRELESLLAADPANPTAAERLARIAEKDGKPAQAAEFRRKKAEIDRVKTRYQRLYDRNQPSRDAVEMAELAERLGRGFEARGFLTLAISDDHSRHDLRNVLERLSRPATIVSNRERTAPVTWARRDGTWGEESTCRRDLDSHGSRLKRGHRARRFHEFGWALLAG